MQDIYGSAINKNDWVAWVPNIMITGNVVAVDDSVVTVAWQEADPDEGPFDEMLGTTTVVDPTALIVLVSADQ